MFYFTWFIEAVVCENSRFLQTLTLESFELKKLLVYLHHKTYLFFN
jgi:hypothetical protein